MRLSAAGTSKGIAPGTYNNGFVFTEEMSRRGIAEAEHLACLALVEDCRRPTPWQYVIQGPTSEVRAQVCAALLLGNKDKAARRYAMCGRGDVIVTDQEGKGHCVRPMRCGHRMCPRCSRWRGSHFIRAVLKHLSVFDHGPIYGYVFTQRVIPQESLDDAWKRLMKAWSSMLQWWGRRGLVGGCVAFHVVYSEGANGWHVHAHVTAEFKKQVPDQTGTWWNGILQRSDPGYFSTKPLFGQELCSAGKAAGVYEDEGGDLFRESEHPVLRALQYNLRELTAGVERWEEFAKGGLLMEMVAQTEGKKSRRLLGQWALSVEERAAVLGVTLDEPEEGKECVKKLEWGTVDEMIWRALSGDYVAAEMLGKVESNVRNDTGVAVRMVECFGAIRKVV